MIVPEGVVVVHGASPVQRLPRWAKTAGTVLLPKVPDDIQRRVYEMWARHGEIARAKAGR